MKKIIIISALSALVFASCGTSTNLKNEQDSLAYVIGFDLGSYIKNLDSTINIDVVAAAMKDVMAGKAKVEQEQAYNFLNEYFTVRKPAKAKAESAAYLAKVEKENKNIKKTASGLLYEVLTPGSEVKATGTDKVRVVYEGKLVNGKVFDSSISRGDTAEFGLNQVIQGWAEGIQLVGKGGKIKLWIPSDLGYGEQGYAPAIPGNEALTFEVTLVDVIADTTAVAPVQ